MFYIFFGLAMIVTPLIIIWSKHGGTAEEAMEKWMFNANLQQMIYCQLFVVLGAVLMNIGVVTALKDLGR